MERSIQTQPMLTKEKQTVEELLDKMAQQKRSNDTEKQEDLKQKVGSLNEIDPYVTSYVCLLVPRFEEHLLAGDLSEDLDNWMKEICVSFGWHLKFIDIKPNYLHWVMTVSIHTYPTHFMKIIRRESSKKIFVDFPRFKRKNVSNDFWAPWFFAGLGEVPYSQSAILSFIYQIRMEQGLH